MSLQTISPKHIFHDASSPTGRWNHVPRIELAEHFLCILYKNKASAVCTEPYQWRHGTKILNFRRWKMKFDSEGKRTEHGREGAGRWTPGIARTSEIKILGYTVIKMVLIVAE